MAKLFTNFSYKVYKLGDVDFDRIDIREDINDSNLRIMKVADLMMMVIFLIMFALSFILPNYKSNRFFYGFESVETLMILLAAHFVLPKMRKLILPFLYFFVALLYYYGIHVGIIVQHSNLAVTACLFLTALPLLFIDDALRMLVVAVSSAVLTAVLMVLMKDKSVLVVDLTDVLFSVIMGIALAIESNRIRIHSYIREHEFALAGSTDGLTGLWNKNALVEKISAVMESEEPDGYFFILDIDHFKEINDTYGHNFGDSVLEAAGVCVRSAAGENGIAGRFGGDEFIFYIGGVDEGGAADAAEKLLRELYSKVKMPDSSEGLQGSVGAAGYARGDGLTYDGLMIKADKALYVTKENGRSGYTLYSESGMERRAVKQG